MLPPRLHQAICQPLVCQVGHSRVVWHPVRHRGLEDFDRQLVVDQICIVVEEHRCEALASTLNATSNSPRMLLLTRMKLQQYLPNLPPPPASATSCNTVWLEADASWTSLVAMIIAAERHPPRKLHNAR